MVSVCGGDAQGSARCCKRERISGARGGRTCGQSRVAEEMLECAERVSIAGTVEWRVSA